MPGHRGIPPGGTRGTVYREVARLRLEDARELLQRQRALGAIYLAGYAVECLLKYGVTRRRNTHYLPPELEIHGIDRLLQEAGLGHALQSSSSIEALFSEFADKWGPGLRYRTTAISMTEASRLYQQTEQVYNWINENLV